MKTFCERRWLADCGSEQITFSVATCWLGAQLSGLLIQSAETMAPLQRPFVASSSGMHLGFWGSKSPVQGTNLTISGYLLVLMDAVVPK